MAKTVTKTQRTSRPLSVHFPDVAERRRLVVLAKKDGRSTSNLVLKFIREGMDRMENQGAGRV